MSGRAGESEDAKASTGGGRVSAAFTMPMFVTELDMVTLVRLLQFVKANWPMLHTELGMVTLVRLVHCTKAHWKSQ